MEIHCSHIDCDIVESVSTTDLQPLYPYAEPSQPPIDTNPVSDFIKSGPTPASGGGFPYSIEDTINCIKEQLPSWEVYLEDNEHGGQTLKTMCPKHFKKENLTKLITKYINEFWTPIGGLIPDGSYFDGSMPEQPKAPTENLNQYLVEVEAHLKTLAQESENSTHYTMELANRSKKIRDEMAEDQDK